MSILSPLYPRSDQELTFRIGQLQSQLLNASTLRRAHCEAQSKACGNNTLSTGRS